MDTVKILHCADLHIGASEALLGEKSYSRKAEALITFENIIKLAAEEKVELMLIAGDLFCSNSVERSSVNRVLECIGSLEDVPVVYAAGNHDPFNSGSPFYSAKLPENLHILPEKDSSFYFENIGTRVYGRSFGEVYLPGEARFTLTPDSESINIMCQHGEVRSDLSANYNSITVEFIDNCKMDYIALGHIHKRSEIARRGDTFFSYCGCAEGLGFDELGDKGVYIGEVGKGKCDLKFFKTSFRNHERVTVDLSGCENNSAAAEKIISELSAKYGERFTDNLYKIILSGDVGDGNFFDTSEIASRLNSTVYFAKVIDNTEVRADLELLKGEKSLKGIFVSKMLERIEKDPEDKKLRAALNIGLKAFTSEVDYIED